MFKRKTPVDPVHGWFGDHHGNRIYHRADCERGRQKTGMGLLLHAAECHGTNLPSVFGNVVRINDPGDVAVQKVPVTLRGRMIFAVIQKLLQNNHSGDRIDHSFAFFSAGIGGIEMLVGGQGGPTLIPQGNR